MKLATLRNATRDGELVVVNREMTRCVSAARIASTLQYALDNWDRVQDANGNSLFGAIDQQVVRYEGPTRARASKSTAVQQGAVA